MPAVVEISGPSQKRRISIAGASLLCGGEGIRTPGKLPYGGFQNRCLRPLGHASISGRSEVALLLSIAGGWAASRATDHRGR